MHPLNWVDIIELPSWVLHFPLSPFPLCSAAMFAQVSHLLAPPHRCR